MKEIIILKKQVILQRLINTGIVAVVRADNKEQARHIADACIEGGVSAIEMTFTVPGVSDIMKSLTVSYGEDRLILGAGTVLDPETARIAILSGAKYVVTPALSIETMKLCNRYAIPCMPGVCTPADAIKALEAGADIIKIFPGELFGPKIIKAFKGPVPQGNFMPTGGVDTENVSEWIKAGAVAVGAGSSLTGPAKTGDYGKITELCKVFIEKIRKARM